VVRATGTQFCNPVPYAKGNDRERTIRQPVHRPPVADAVLKLFEGDGTLYFATGYFTWSGYLTIRDALVEFLARNPGNEVYIVVSTGADQFSRLVAHALWDLDVDDRLRF